MKNRLQGTIDLSFKQVTPFLFSNLDDFSEGRAFAIVDDEKKSLGGYINKAGKFCTEQTYTVGQPFENGRAIVARRLLEGVIDKDGKEIIPVKYDQINRLPGGRFRAFWGRHVEVFSPDGRLLAQNNFEKNLYSFEWQLAYDGRYTLRDEIGRKIGTESFSDAQVVSSNQIIVCKKPTESGSKYFGLIDCKGNWLVEPKFSSLEFISKDRFFAYPPFEEIHD